MPIDCTPTEEQREMQLAVRSFVTNELLPLERTLLERERVGGPGQLTRPELRDLQRRARTSGLWGVDTPVELGGVSLPATTQALIYEELGRVAFEFEFGGSAPDLLFACRGSQREEYLLPTLHGERQFCFALSEPEMGSDVRNLRTTAVRGGGGWVLNGEKTWITRGDSADYAITFAQTVAGDGTAGITAFLVDRTRGFTSSPIPLMGSHQVASLSFLDVRVPEGCILGEVNGGFRLAMNAVNKNRAYILPARNVGASSRLLEMSVEYARNRTTFGKPLAERENIQWMLAESDIEIRAARGLIFQAAARADHGADYRFEAAASKFFASHVAQRIVDRVMQIHGALGYSKGLVIERWYRDLRVERIYEGSDEMQLSTIARGLLSGKGAVADERAR